MHNCEVFIEPNVESLRCHQDEIDTVTALKFFLQCKAQYGYNCGSHSTLSGHEPITPILEDGNRSKTASKSSSNILRRTVGGRPPGC